MEQQTPAEGFRFPKDSLLNVIQSADDCSDSEHEPLGQISNNFETNKMLIPDSLKQEHSQKTRRKTKKNKKVTQVHSDCEGFLPSPFSSGSLSDYHSLKKFPKQRDESIIKQKVFSSKNDTQGNHDIGERKVNDLADEVEQVFCTTWGPAWEEVQTPRWVRGTGFAIELLSFVIGIQKFPSPRSPNFTVVYPFMPLILCFAFPGLSISKAVTHYFLTDPGTSSKVPLFDISLAVTAIAALFFHGSLSCRGNGVAATKESIYQIAALNRFATQWARSSASNAIVALILWIVVFFERVALINSDEAELESKLHAALFAVPVAVVIASAFTIVHISHGLEAMIHKFMIIYAQTPGNQRVHLSAWNLLTATLRAASTELEWCFLSFGAMAVITIFVLAVDFNTCPPLFVVPHIILIGALLLVFLKAATVTELCSRVPAVVNELDFGEAMQSKVMMVQHIQASNAGFLVFGTSVTLSTIYKFSYFTFVACVSVGSRIFQTNQSLLQQQNLGFR